MPTWLQIVLALGGSAVISTVIGILINKIFKHFENKLKRIEDLEREHRENERLKEDRARQEAWENKIVSIIEPISNKIDDIDAKLEKDQKATVVDLRVQMMKLKDAWKERGWSDEFDKLTWYELYSSYTSMGGNHLAERVNKWQKEVEDLPESERANDSNSSDK